MAQENFDESELATMQKIASTAATRVVRFIPWLCSDDLSQAAMVEMWSQHDQWDGSGAFHSYLWPIARSACAREARRRMAPVSGDCWRAGPMKGLRGVELTDLNERSQPAEQETYAAHAQFAARVRARLLAVLPRSEAVFILACQGAELSAEEAAYAFDMTPAAVRARTYRARKLLRNDPELRALWER